jgi:hypothetical protein
MSLNLWPSTRTKLPSRTIRAFKGVNRLDTYSIDPSYSPLTRNLSSSLTPALTTKPGFSVLTSVGARVIGLASWKNTELHAVFGDGTWRRWNGSAWTTLKSGLNTTAEWSFVNFKGAFIDTNLIGTNGIDPAQRYDGSTVQALANAPTGANYVDQHDNRLYVAVENKVYFSGLNVADEWTVTGRPDDSSPGTIRKETYVGENIVGIRSGAGHATVFFPSSSWELYGTSASDYILMPVAEDFGAINNKCVVNLGGVLYFLGDTGIYRYSGGVRPQKDFSLPVQWYVDNMSPATQNCCVGTDGRYLYITIPLISSTVVLVWDSQENAWNVWDDMIPTQMTKMGDALYMAEVGNVCVVKLGGSNLNAGLFPISWEWQSKTFTGQSMGQNMRFMRLWITVDKPSGSTLQVYMTKEPEADSGWVLVGDLNAVSDLQSKRICINPSQMANSPTLRFKLAGTGQCTVREISWDERQFPIV